MDKQTPPPALWAFRLSVERDPTAWMLTSDQETIRKAYKLGGYDIVAYSPVPPVVDRSEADAFESFYGPGSVPEHSDPR